MLVGQLRYLSVFAAARGALFFAPLVLASEMTASDYGALERAYGAAVILASILTLGTGSVMPLVLTESAPSGVTAHAIRLHHVILAIFAAAMAVLAAALGAPRSYWQLSVLLGVVALQALKSTEMKSIGRANASLAVDAALFGSMAVAALGATAILQLPAIVFVWLAAIACYAVLVLDVGWRLGGTVGTAISSWRASIAVGLPLMITGLVAALIASSGRVGIGWLADPNTAATYGVLSRGAALPIVAHQVVLVARFRSAFTCSQHALEQLLLAILVFVAISALVFWSISPWTAWLLGPAFAAAAQANRPELLWLLAQAILWSGVAVNDLANTRFGTARAVLSWSVPALAVSLTLGTATVVWLGTSLASFVHVHGVALLVFYIAQASAMRRNGVVLPRVWGFAIVAYLALIATAFAMRMYS